MASSKQCHWITYVRGILAGVVGNRHSDVSIHISNTYLAKIVRIQIPLAHT